MLLYRLFAKYPSLGSLNQPCVTRRRNTRAEPRELKISTVRRGKKLSSLTELDTIDVGLRSNFFDAETVLIISEHGSDAELCEETESSCFESYHTIREERVVRRLDE